MIVKQVAAGARTAGLLAYLYGPGVGEARGGTVHVNPRTVASWDGQPSVHSPKQLASGRHSVGGLARSLDAPVALVTKAPAKHVGHIVVANHPDDPVLTDAQWRQIAADVMRRAGLSKGPQDPDAVRWIAVRHDDTSIHIAYTKVRESGRPAGYVNYTRAWEAMRHEWEERLGLVPTGKADGTARRPYGQAESARTKVARAAGEVEARPDTAELRQLCRVIALEVHDVYAYFDRLRSAGVIVSQERDAAGGLTGYRVALRCRADGKPVEYSPKRLDPALDLLDLGARWDTTGHAALPAFPSPAPAATLTPTATPANGVPQDADDVEDVLRRAAAVTGYRAFSDAADSCGAANRRSSAGMGRAGIGRPAKTAISQLRAVSALLSTSGRAACLLERQTDVAELILAVATLLTERAAWHELHSERVSAAALLRSRRTILAVRPTLPEAAPNAPRVPGDPLVRESVRPAGRRLA